MTKTEEFIRKARLKLSSKNYRFFGLCLYNIRIIPTEDRKDIEGWVNYESNSERFENQIHVNSRIIDEHITYKTLNMIDIMLHEFNHIIRRHDIRRGSRDFKLWNVACDHVIDKSLKKLGLSRPIIRWNIIPTIEYDNSLQSEEEVYNWLRKNPDQVSTSQSVDGGIHVEDHNRKIDFKFFPDLSPEDLKSEQKQTIEEYVSQIRAIYNIEKEKGSIPSNLITTFDELLKIEIPWETLLDKAIKSKTTEKANRRSWRKLNKYYVSLNINLPGFVASKNKDSVNTLIVHIDSSGSISTEDLKKAAYIIIKSAQYFEQVKLIVADVKIHQEVTFNYREFSRIEDYFKIQGIQGRGGTSHKNVFDYFDKVYEENPDGLSLTISITDLCSDIDSVIDSAKFIKAVPLILLNTSGGKRIIDYKNVNCINID
jgi:predicted metal-dependent peptidase